MTKPTDTLTHLANIATSAAREAEVFVSRLDGDHEPGGLGLAIIQAATQRARRPRRSTPHTPALGGQWVRHPTFGLGEVLATIGKGRDRKYRIDFIGEVLTLRAQYVKVIYIT